MSMDRALIRGSRAEPPEAESLLALGCSNDHANLPPFRNFCKLRKRGYLLQSVAWFSLTTARPSSFSLAESHGVSAKLKVEVVISELCDNDNVTVLTFRCVICEILLSALLPTFSFNTIPSFFRYDMENSAPISIIRFSKLYV